MTHHLRQRPALCPDVLPAGFAMFLAVDTVAAALHGRLDASGVLVACAAVAGITSFVAEPVAAMLLAGIGWLTVIGFSRPPYAQLRPTGTAAARAAVVLGVTALASVGLGLLFRWYWRRLTLASMGTYAAMHAPRPAPERALTTYVPPAADLPGGTSLPGGISVRRRVAGVALAAAGLPLLTVALAAVRQHLDLTDDLLVYLVAVVAIAVVGGFWPAVLAAITASLLLNWYFTKPLHTLTIAEPRNALALLLFVTVAVTVSSVVHLAARRAVQAARSSQEAASLLELAQTVLGGADTPTAVLDHLTSIWGGRAELAEQVRGQWVSVATSGAAKVGAVATQIPVSDSRSR